MAFLIKLIAYLASLALVASAVFVSTPTLPEPPLEETNPEVLLTDTAASSTVVKIETEKALSEKDKEPARESASLAESPKPASVPTSVTLPDESSTLKVATLPTTPLIFPPTVPSEPPAAVEPKYTFNELNQKTRESLVNILCTSKRGGSFNPLSGSGIVVDERGVILTNAHVAEYFLLTDYIVPGNIECVIRKGEPARPAYKAKILYISPLWVKKNYQKITDAEPTGTGEHDFALLLITESVNQDTLPLPKFFPALDMDVRANSIRKGDEVLVAGFPAGFLSGITIQKDLYPTSSVVTAREVYSFTETTVADLFSIGGSPVAQEGSSGGAVVARNGMLIGLVATASAGATTGERDLHAITMSHLDDSFRKDTGFPLSELFSKDLNASADSFNANVVPGLKKLLETALDGEEGE